MPIETQEENRMGTAKMFPLIMFMSLPAMFSMLIQALYNIVDSYFVAQVSDKAVPVAWLLAKVTNDVGMVWWAFPIAEAVSLAVSIVFLVRLYKTELKKCRTKP